MRHVRPSRQHRPPPPYQTQGHSVSALSTVSVCPIEVAPTIKRPIMGQHNMTGAFA
ncbi:hypothetical protein KCP70_10495 [Salmonella enterica subsp. enterica]|nr:hypothetical protein KCP70_10495 [Salmonella enterica subsp. enterica]